MAVSPKNEAEQESCSAPAISLPVSALGLLSSSALSSAQVDLIVSDHSLFSSVRGLDIGVKYTKSDVAERALHQFFLEIVERNLRHGIVTKVY